MKIRIINGAEFPYHGEILYNDGRVIINDMHDGTGCAHVYKLTDYKTPYGRDARDWLSCGVWKRVIIGYRETEVYGREALTARDLSGIAAAYA
jgi:hypothetical protein